VIWLVLVGAAIGAGWLLGHGNAESLAWTAPEAPKAGLLASLALTLGVYGRERLRLRQSYASPTRAYLGKFTAMAGLAVAAAYLLAPVDWPLDVLYGSAAGVAGGGALWISNLPRKL